MIIGEDFRFRDDIPIEETDTVPIELLTGPYKGIVYAYDKVRVTENFNVDAKISFSYTLYELGEGRETPTTLESDKRFGEHIGLVLNTLLLEAVGDTLNEYREDDPQESDTK